MRLPFKICMVLCSFMGQLLPQADSKVPPLAEYVSIYRSEDSSNVSFLTQPDDRSSQSSSPAEPNLRASSCSQDDAWVIVAASLDSDTEDSTDAQHCKPLLLICNDHDTNPPSPDMQVASDDTTLESPLLSASFRFGFPRQASRHRLPSVVSAPDLCVLCSPLISRNRKPLPMAASSNGFHGTRPPSDHVTKTPPDDTAESSVTHAAYTPSPKNGNHDHVTKTPPDDMGHPTHTPLAYHS